MKIIERAEVVDNKYCSACSAGVACLADGPIPDFEFVGAAGLLGLAD